MLTRRSTILRHTDSTYISSLLTCLCIGLLSLSSSTCTSLLLSPSPRSRDNVSATAGTIDSFSWTNAGYGAATYLIGGDTVESQNIAADTATAAPHALVDFQVWVGGTPAEAASARIKAVLALSLNETLATTIPDMQNYNASSDAPFPLPLLTSIWPMRRGSTGPQESCVACDAGRYQEIDNNNVPGSCQFCPVGQWSGPNATGCSTMTCTLGMKSTKIGAHGPTDGCKACPCGKKGHPFAINECADYSCPPGSTPVNKGNTKSMCQECPIGRAQGLWTTPGVCDETTSCAACAVGKVTCLDTGFQEGRTETWSSDRFGVRTNRNFGCCR